MVFGLFKKKKKVPEDGTQGTAKPEKPVKVSKKKEKTPKNSKESTDAGTKNPVEPQRIQDDNEDQWKYDSIVQFLQSPLWTIPLVEFVDEHCFIFDNPKQDKPEYVEVHETYKKKVEMLVEDMLCELEIEIEKFTEIVHAGVNDKTYKKTFEQFLTVDNFTVFKKIMFKRNKELELEALQQLHELDKQNAIASGENAKETERAQKEHEQDLQKLTQEKEEAELEHALALSLAVEEERQKLVEQEDYELQEAMRQSEVEYSKFQQDVKEKQEQIELEKKAKQEELDRYEREKHEREELQKQKEKELDKEKEIARVHAEEVARKKSQENEAPKSLEDLVEEEKIEHRPEETKSQELGISRKKLEPLKNASKPSLPELAEAEPKKSCMFPPIKGNAGYDPMADYTAENEKKPVKHEVKDETLEERKKRLQAQRDLILAKKKAERDAELKNYEARRGSVQKVNTQKSMGEDVSNHEIVRRKEIYGKLKGEL